MRPPDERHDRRQTAITRIDKPHQMVGAGLVAAEAPSLETLFAIAGKPSDTGGGAHLHDQLERQASELGSRLQTRQRDLLRRESEFNARAAQIENELRTARLMIREREFELQERNTAFAESYQQLQEQNANLVAARATVEAESSAQQNHLKTNVNDARVSTEVWQKRLREIDRDERTLKARLADISDKQRQLDEQANDLRDQQREYATRLAADRATDRQRLAKQLLELRERSEQLERRRVSVRQLHADVSRMYREAIEIRICTEELWAQMKDVSPAELTKKLGELRRKLNDQYTLAQQSLEDQKTEIEQLVGRLAKHEQDLRQQRGEIRGWVTRRQEEIERQATLLLERERELDQQSVNLRHSEGVWKEHRARLEQELRRLKRVVG